MHFSRESDIIFSGEQNMSVSIIEIARKAKVSKSTVSRVLNGQSGVSEDAVIAVRKAVKSLNYNTSMTKRGPKAKNKNLKTLTNIALLFHNMPLASISSNYNVYYNFQTGLGKSLSRYSMNIITVGQEQVPHFCDMCRENDVKGILVHASPTKPADELLNVMDEIPSIWFPRLPDYIAEKQNCVTFNNAAVGRLAAEHFMKKGHKNVAFVNLNPGSAILSERENTFRAILEKNNVSVNSFYMTEGMSGYYNDLKNTEKVLKSIMAQGNGPTGIFLPADAMTMPFYHCMQDMGVNPMRDMEIVSVDNVASIMTGLAPSPVEIDTGFEQMGALALNHLDWQIKNPSEKHKVMLCVEPYIMNNK